MTRWLWLLLLTGCPKPPEPRRDAPVERTSMDVELAISNTGRWRGILREDTLVLLDQVRNEERRVPHADVSGNRTYSGPTSIAFSADESRAAYFRISGTSHSIVIHDLANAEERDVSLDRGIPWAIVPDDTGPWATVYAVTKGGDARLRLPSTCPEADRTADCVAQSIATSHVLHGDPPIRGRLRLDTGEVVFDDPTPR